MTKPSKPDPEDQSRRILERIHTDTETVGQSSIARSANQARDHMLGKDKDPDDPIEVWGTRIGRALSVIAFIGLSIWLFNYLGRG